MIDVRDLAGWMVAMAERGAHGRFNAVGPAQPLTIGALLDRCNAVSGGGADIVWADNQALLDREVEPWSDLPLWLGGDPEMEWMDCVDPGPATAAGLSHRPIDETIADTLAWHRANRDAPGRAGFRMSRAREAELLADLA